MSSDSHKRKPTGLGQSTAQTASRDELTDDWLQMRAVVNARWVGQGATQSHVQMAMDLLHALLRELYAEPSITRLCAEKEEDYGFRLRLSTTLQRLVDARRWQRATAQRVCYTLRCVLRRTLVPPRVVSAARLPSKLRRVTGWDGCGGQVQQEHCRILPVQYRPLSPEHPVRRLLDSWIASLRGRTNHHSRLSLRNVMAFFCLALVPRLGLELEHWDAERALAAARRLCTDEQALREATAGAPRAGFGAARASERVCVEKKLHWVRLFVREILRADFAPSKELVRKLLRERREAREPDDGSDPHRISKENLEKLYAVAQRDALNELFFLVLLTTGMRIGGFVKMKALQVAELRDGKEWRARSEGRTLERGNKPFSFKLHCRARELLELWLNQLRPPSESEYVFPGASLEHACTHTFRRRFARMCQEAGLHGREFHPHALRHCYSHILLELGNTADTVAKLINHSSVTTTEKYYLKESAAQVSRRAIIPWLREAKADARARYDPVPSFLAGAVLPQDEQREQRMANARNVVATLRALS